MKIIDKVPKKNPAILDNFMVVPDKLTTKQKQALKRLQELHKHRFTEVSDWMPQGRIVEGDDNYIPFPGGL